MKILLATATSVYWWIDAYRRNTSDNKSLKSGSMPNLAVYYLASILREKGHTPMVEDLQYDQVDLSTMQFPSLERRINDADIVGISSSSLDWFLAKEIAKRIKNIDPSIPVVVGGVHATYADEYILKSTKVDYVIRKEGERTLPELIDVLESKKEINDVYGLSYKTSDNITKRNKDRPPLTKEELEHSPLPAFDLLPDDTYGKLPLELSRGCKSSCIFCSIPFRKSWRGLGLKVVQERIDFALDYTKKLFGDRKGIFFTDECFTTDRDRAEQIITYINGKGLDKIGISFEAKINDLLNSRIIECSAHAPLDIIQVGVECGYDEGLMRIKGITTKDVEKCASKAAEYGISENIFYGFIVGFPHETKEECMKTIRFACDLVMKHGGKTHINWLKLYPSSRLWEARGDYGVEDGFELFDEPIWKFEERIRQNVSRTQNISSDDIAEMRTYIQNLRTMSQLVNEKSSIYLPTW
jgi:radical SAM superfamily enzyme YgiQ (UPF0313 family)